MGSVKSRANVVKMRKNERDRKSWPRSGWLSTKKRGKEKSKKNVGRLHKRRGWKKNEGRRGWQNRRSAEKREREREKNGQERANR